MSTETLTAAATCTAYPPCSRIAAHTPAACPTIREVRALYDSWPGGASSMPEAYDRQEALARITEDPWSQAHILTTRRIVEHPLFPKVVREVAVAEQPKGAPRRYRLNSLTYGAWWTRGMSPTPSDPQGHSGRYGWDRRARLFAEQIRHDLHLNDDRPSEGVASVYVTAREWVRAREFPGGRP